MMLLVLGPIPVAGSARADALHFLGPEGSGVERRGLVVVEPAGGGCAPLVDARADSPDPGVRVELQEAEGACARWLFVAANEPRDHVHVRVHHAAGVAEAALAMGSERGLSVTVRRRGRQVEARVDGAPSGETVRVVAYHDDAQTELTRRGDVFAGVVDAAGPIGVVARSGSLTGAAALNTRGRRAGPSALIIPSELAVPLGGAPRVAAFLIVVDSRGRLSRNVPVRVSSERGVLRRLDWIEPGLAAVSLSVDSNDTRAVDLSVSDAERLLATAQLEVAAGSPSRAELELPASATAESRFVVRASIATLEGDRLEPARVLIACPGGDTVSVDDDGRAECVAPDRGPVQVAVHALVDGRAVPFASERLEVHAPAEPEPEPEREPEPRPVAVEPPRPRTAAEHAPGLRLAALARGGVDVSGRASAGGAIRLDVPLSRVLDVGPVLRYSHASVDAQPADERIVVSLEGARHAFALGAHASYQPLLGPVEGVLRGEVAVSLRHDRGALGNTGSDSLSVVPVASVAAGVALGDPEGLSLELTLGALVTPLQPDRAWRDAPVRAFLEVAGALTL